MRKDKFSHNKHREDENKHSERNSWYQVLASTVPITGSACEGVTCGGMIEIYCCLEMLFEKYSGE